MTAPMQDKLYWRGKWYYPQSSVLFSPRDFGLTPHPFSTGCETGYYCELKLLRDGLFLTHLEIGLAPQDNLIGDEQNEHKPHPVLPGYQPDRFSGVDYYHNIKLPLFFSGQCLVCDQAVPYQTELDQPRPQPRYWMLLLNKGQFVELRAVKAQQTAQAFKASYQDPTWQQHMWQGLSDLLLEPPAYLKHTATDQPQATEPESKPFDKHSKHT